MNVIIQLFLSFIEKLLLNLKYLVYYFIKILLMINHQKNHTLLLVIILIQTNILYE